MRLLLVLAMLAVASPAVAQTADAVKEGEEIDHTFDLHGVKIGELAFDSIVIDTGATISVLSPEDLDKVQDKKLAYNAELLLADGQKVMRPVYVVTRVRVGDCELHDVRFAALPGSSGAIGVQALEQLMPITLGKEYTDVTCQKLPD